MLFRSDCSSFTNPYQMLEYANMRLADYASPRISYVLKAMDLSVLTGYEHETWELGDTVTVKDDDLNLSVKTRIVRREYNLQEPWNTVLELTTTLRELGDSSSRWDSAADTLESADLVDSQEMKDLVPFNHLRNSRADSGLSYWQSSGFSVDADNGVSGTASFKCEGALNTTKSLALIIFVVCDYITGVMCAISDKKLSSEVGFKGICRKVLIFLLVGIGNVIDVQVLGHPGVLRTAIIFFYHHRLENPREITEYTALCPEHLF